MLVDISSIEFTLETRDSQFKSKKRVPATNDGNQQLRRSDGDGFDALLKSTSSQIELTRNLLSYKQSAPELPSAAVTEPVAEEQRITTAAAAAVETSLTSNLLDIVGRQNTLIQKLSSKLEILEKKLSET